MAWMIRIWCSSFTIMFATKQSMYWSCYAESAYHHLRNALYATAPVPHPSRLQGSASSSQRNQRTNKICVSLTTWKKRRLTQAEYSTNQQTSKARKEQILPAGHTTGSMHSRWVIPRELDWQWKCPPCGQQSFWRRFQSVLSGSGHGSVRQAASLVSISHTLRGSFDAASCNIKLISDIRLQLYLRVT